MVFAPSVRATDSATPDVTSLPFIVSVALASFVVAITSIGEVPTSPAS